MPFGKGTDLEQRWPGQQQFECAVCGAAFWRYAHRNRGEFITCGYGCANVVKNWRRARAAYEAVRQMSEPERAWLAAAIDGEGCITYSASYPRVTIINTDLPFLNRAREFMAVGRLREKPREQAHHKQAWTLTVDGYAAIAVLDQIIDWLVIKQDKAAVALSSRFDSLVKLQAFEARLGGESVALRHRDC